MRILNFGSCNIDYVYSMDHTVRVGETQSTYGLEIFPGGKGLNQSIAIAHVEKKNKSPYWSKVIWDVTAVAWLLNDGDRFMNSRVLPTAMPLYDGRYAETTEEYEMRYVYFINRGSLMEDLIRKLTGDV